MASILGKRVSRWESITLPTISILALSLMTIAAVFLYVTQTLSLFQATVVMALPFVVAAVVLRPSWVVLGLIAAPPGLLNTRYRPVILLLLLTVGAQLLLRGRAYAGMRSGLYPFLALILAGFLFQADVDSEAALATDTFRKQLVYYALLGLVSYNATKIGELELGSLIKALLVGVWATVLLKVAISGLGPVPWGVGTLPSEVESLFFGRNFAFFAVIGFSVYFAKWLLPSQVSVLRIQPMWAAGLALFLLGLTLFSLVRSAWLAAIFVIFLISTQGRRRGYWLVGLLAIVVVLSVPIASERVTPSAIHPASDITSGRWSLWSEVWAEEAAPALPWGNGFGHAWSITPVELFGFDTFRFEGDPQSFLYLHNDFLFWIVELGFLGLLLMIIFWARIISTLRQLLNGESTGRAAAMMLLGTIVVMFANHLFGNAFVFRPVAERFFVAIGFLYGIRAHIKEPGKAQVMESTVGQLQDG